MGQVRGRAAAPGSFQSPWRDPAAVEVVVRSGVLWAARASLRLPAGPHRRRGELFVRPSVLTKHEAARLGGEESSCARAPCQVTCCCTRRTAFACRGFKRLSPSARRLCGWIHYCVRRAAFKRLGIKRPFLLMFGSLSSSCGKRHSEAWAPCALFPRLSSPYMLYPKAQ